MQSKKRFSWMEIVLRGAAVLLLASGLANFAEAADVLITAEFRPNVLNPTANRFTNTTPRGLYCSWVPGICEANDLYFFDLPITLTKTYTKGAAPRQRWYIAFPAQRQLSLVSDSGRQASVTVGVAGYSGHLLPGLATNPVFTQLVYGGCSYVYTAGHLAWVRFGWRVRDPRAPAPCHSQGDGGSVGFTHEYQASHLGIGLNITTDSPLALPNGIYEGSLTYTVGGMGADFDFGDDAVLSDNSLTFRFRFTVAHELAVDFPPGSDRAILVPEGGWNSWIDHGRLPTRLSRDLPFSLSSSAPFSVTLQCQHPQPGGDCGLRNVTTPTAPEVPVEVAISMPGFHTVGSNVDALKLKLSTQRASRFTSSTYAANRASHLRFDVNGGHVKEILDHPGDKYRGNVTVVFDAQP